MFRWGGDKPSARLESRDRVDQAVLGRYGGAAQHAGQTADRSETEAAREIGDLCVHGEKIPQPRLRWMGCDHGPNGEWRLRRIAGHTRAEITRPAPAPVKGEAVVET